MGLGAIDVAGAVAPTPDKYLGTNCKASSYSNLHRTMGTRLQQHGEGVSTKDGGRQSEGDSGTRCTFGNFSSLHSMSCWFSVPGLAQVRPRPFSARQGSPLGRLETHQSQYERHYCTIIRFIMYIKMMHMPWPPDKTPHGSFLFSMRYCWHVLNPRCSIYLLNS